MHRSIIEKSLVSTFIVIALVTSGFIGILVFEGMVEEGGVEAVTILYVGGSGLGNYSKIQDAINDANPGDTIRVYAGTYIENVVLNKKISLIGNSSLNTTIDGSGTGDVVISGVTVTGAGVTGASIVGDTVSVSEGSTATQIDVNLSGAWSTGNPYTVELVSTKGNKFAYTETA